MYREEWNTDTGEIKKSNTSQEETGKAMETRERLVVKHVWHFIHSQSVLAFNGATDQGMTEQPPRAKGQL